MKYSETTISEKFEKNAKSFERVVDSTSGATYYLIHLFRNIIHDTERDYQIAEKLNKKFHESHNLDRQADPIVISRDGDSNIQDNEIDISQVIESISKVVGDRQDIELKEGLSKPEIANSYYLPLVSFAQYISGCYDYLTSKQHEGE